MRAIIAGCGLSGSVIARELAEQGVQVEIYERRNHIGGNMYDYVDGHGFLVQQYGPHTFHTNDPALFEYMCRYGEWDAFRLICGAEIDGRYTPTPFNFTTIDTFYAPEAAARLKAKLTAAYAGRTGATVVEVLEHEDPDIRGYAQFLFDKDYSLYTAKQWGIPPAEVDVSVLKRVPLRFSYDVGYFDDSYQVMPATGWSFTRFFESLLDHPGIRVRLGEDVMAHLSLGGDEGELLWDGKPVDAPVIYTGPIDELFGCRFGRLPYRSLRFEWIYEEKDSRQEAPVVAYPQAEGYTRITEYKKLPVQNRPGTVYAVEYSLPYRENRHQEPYYPVLTEASSALLERYEALASQYRNLYCCGRLGDFKYYNMDQALKRALSVARSILR